MRFLSVYPLGAGAGLLPCLAEWMATGQAPPPAALAGFSMVGGMVSIVLYLLSLIVMADGRARRLAVTGTGVLIALELVFFVNVVLIPGESSLAPRSLAVSLAVVLGVLGCTVALAGRVTSLSRGGLRALGLAGVVAATISLTLVSARWPKERSTPPRQGQGPNILVIVIDAARRDHLTAYGYDRDTSPFLAQLARSARVYERAFAASSTTRASVPVMLGAQRTANGEVESVQGLLAQAGYTTACFSDNPLLEEGSELSAPFDHVALGLAPALQFPQRVFDGTFVGEFVLRWPFLARLWDDERLTTKAIAWAAQVKGPVFLYVHLMDAHMPYKQTAIDGRGWSGRRIDSPRTGMQLTPSEASDVVAHYDGGLRTGDRQVDRLLNAASVWGRPYVAIVTADHGESLGERGRWGHSGDLSPERLAVPLIVAGQGAVPGRVTLPVGHRSIALTILAAAKVKCDLCGQADLRTSQGDAVVEGILPPDLHYRISHGYKLIWNPRSGQRNLYHLSTDPLEVHDLARAHPRIADRLQAGWSGSFNSSTPSPEDLERFRALGYLGN